MYALLLPFFGLLGCTVPNDTTSPPQKVPTPTETSDTSPTVSIEDVVVAIQDRQTLQRLSTSHSLATLLPTANPAPSNQTGSTKWLYEHHQGYRALTEHLSSRIDNIASDIDRDLIIELKDALRYPAGNVGRRFDNRWFSSDIAFFELIGVINRLDKKDIYGDCGEVRFIYRLAYQDANGASSRLPLTMNLVMTPKQDCRTYAQQWVKPKNTNTDDWLVDGPLNQAHLDFKQLELNAQIVRFPSGLETTFAGQALYLLRVYGLAIEDESLVIEEVPLENTPDVQSIQQNPSLKRELVDWTNAHLSEIDNGTYLLPQKFLTTEAISYSTLGIHRKANKPFDVIFNEDAMLKLSLPTGDRQWIRSKESIIDRLNNGSCLGCHQASTTAGFHFLGEDNPTIAGVTNRLALPFSAHFHREQPRRKQQLSNFLNNLPEDTFRPHSLAPNTSTVGTNQVCIPQAEQTHFQSDALWSCETGQTCEIVVESDVGIDFGQCLPTVDALKAGNTCRTGKITDTTQQSNSVFNLHAYTDTFQEQQRYDLPEGKQFTFDSYNCRPTRIGVPLGRTYRKCTSEERAFEPQQTNPTHPEICAVVGGAKFDSCVEKDFHKCLDSIVARGMVDSCHSGNFCREDYICQAIPYQLPGVDSDKGKVLAEMDIGFCTPTYFVFQLRLDGHPIP